MKRSESRRRSDNAHLDLGLLSAYIDDEVTPAEREQVERHLATCHACLEELESLRWTVSLLQEVPPVPVPRVFAVREADLVVERRRFTLPDWLFGGLRWATVATALLLLLVLSGDLLNASRFLARVSPALAPPAPRAVAPEAQEMTVVETVVVEKEVVKVVPEKAPALSETIRTPAALASPVVPKEQMELATAPEPPAEPVVQPKGLSQQPTAPTAIPRPLVTPVPFAEEAAGEEVQALAISPEETPQPVDRLRQIEIALAGLLVVLSGLTLWVRRWVRNPR